MSLLNDLKNIANQAAEKALKMFSSKESWRIVGKHGRDDTRLVDKTVEDFIVNIIFEKYDAVVITEERGIIKRTDNPQYIFVVDPLDGSYNFIKGIPFTSISIAVAEYSENPRSKNVFVGVVKDVFRGDIFCAEKGQGVYVNEKPLEPREVPKALMISGYFNENSVEPFMKVYYGLGLPKVRTLGSAALELCYTSLGTFDAFVDVRGFLRVVDISAGVFIVREAGGYVVDLNGNDLDYSLYERNGIALIASLKKELIDKAISALK
ncbi:MAG: hypothetical protein DRN04_11045 [Thermoprotei archaeon]|nr:MAG: hypothetical protein DRN04_11045 [Thermoprotei archaeon]